MNTIDPKAIKKLIKRWKDQANRLAKHTRSLATSKCYYSAASLDTEVAVIEQCVIELQIAIKPQQKD